MARAAKEAFSKRSRGEVALLVYDSLVDADDPPEHHELRFEGDRLRFLVHVSVRPIDVALVGRLEPPAAGRFELVLEDADLSFVQDSSDGTFHFEPMAHGLVRLAFNAPGRQIQTDWFRV
ncbi:MAG: hypothetical protein M0Z30_10955 [Actinomycetota bacterium]|nr:hypothetical protein [Actinomycetota bacterium]